MVHLKLILNIIQLKNSSISKINLNFKNIIDKKNIILFYNFGLKKMKGGRHGYYSKNT